MKRFFFIPLFTTLSLITLSQHTNIRIDIEGTGFSPEEPTIIIDPGNTNHMLAGANIYYAYRSVDGGFTWSKEVLTSTYGVWGDPCIIVDTAGSYYFFHLSNPVNGNWIDRIVCQKIDDISGTWNNGSYMGLNGTKAQDKEWAIVDRNNNNIYVTWTQFDDYGSTDTSDKSNIRFSKSLDAGLTWSEAKRINEVSGDCIDSDNTVEGAVPAVGPDGEIYVAWAGPAGLVFDRSLDQGETWLDKDIFVDPFPGGWDLDIPGISRCNGFPVTKCDLSGGEHHGTIYINWADQRNGPDDTDIWLAKSTDGGNSWSNPVRVNNDPPGKQQFFTWMDVDQATGNLWFVFYDRRNYDDENTDVYMAVSYDGGETFTNFKVSESPFLPWDNIFFGDYTNISAYNDVVRPIWARLQNGELSIWTAIVDPYVGIQEEYMTDIFNLEQNYPNPFRKSTFISYKVKQPSNLTLNIYDMFGQLITPLFIHKNHMPGKYVESFNPEQYSLSPGIFYFELSSGAGSIQRKMIIVE